MGSAPDGGEPNRTSRSSCSSSPLDTAFEVKIPAGTKVYVGEVGSQGGAFVGGTQQIVVQQPWLIDGVKVVGSRPLQ